MNSLASKRARVKFRNQADSCVNKLPTYGGLSEIKDATGGN